eukprot:TRINITY_DN1233_c0_g1_i1.p1 TRINITY_DN1233_c0_g1~~TRINITY_DN1233_c0_g1_i1.p1  ORF type:complete len:280 (+),score=39.28 TRINITY_DN1233_c0_g1_i1:37-876(+)
MQRLLLTCCVLITLCVAVYGQGFTIGPSASPVAVSNSSLARITAIADDMYQRWYQLDAACDPRAVFAVAYLFMTANAKKLIQNLYFDDGNKMVDFISTFAGRYLDAYTAWENGQYSNVSLPWAVYYNFLATKRDDVTQDITIGMNAHINYDLGIAAYQQGYALPQWRDDYYRVNDLMAQVDANVTNALARYDPQFHNTDWVSQTYFQASIDFVTSWRSNAYSQALAYQAALTPIAVQTLRIGYESSAASTGQSIAIPYPYTTNTTRIPYCQANHYPLVV